MCHESESKSPKLKNKVPLYYKVDLSDPTRIRLPRFVGILTYCTALLYEFVFVCIYVCIVRPGEIRVDLSEKQSDDDDIIHTF